MKRRLFVTVALIFSQILNAAAFAQQQRPRRAGETDSSRILPGSKMIPEGYVLVVRMESRLDSGASRPGDRFLARVNEPITDDAGAMVLPANLQVVGHVVEVAPAQMRRRSGLISITFDMLIMPDGNEQQIIGELTSADPKERKSLKLDEEGAIQAQGGQKKRNAVFIGGGAASGAVIGAIAGGAAIGAGVGAAAGAIAVLLAKGKEAVVEPGTLIGIELSKGIDVRSLASQPRKIVQLAPVLPSSSESKPATTTSPQTQLPSTPVGDPQLLKLSFVQAERINGTSIMIVATAETQGSRWRLRTEEKLQNDVLEVWVKGNPPDGGSSRVISHPTATATFPDPQGAIRKVIIHGLTGDKVINIAPRPAQ